MNETVLSVESLTMEFGGLRAVGDFSFDLKKGAIFGLIGPNGAGKTTVFNMLTGVYEPTHGKVKAFGQDITGLPPYEITRVGLARTFQNIRLFKDLTVLQNLMIGVDQNPHFPSLVGYSFSPIQIWQMVLAALRTRGIRELEEKKQIRCKEILKIFDLDQRSDELARNLPYGDQRKLEIARAIATGAKILLLDEPAAGLNHTETAALMDTIQMIRKKFDVTILLIEHDMKLVMGICEQIAVMDYGVRIALGAPDQIQKDPKVIEAYLGKPKNP